VDFRQILGSSRRTCCATRARRPRETVTSPASLRRLVAR